MNNLFFLPKDELSGSFLHIVQDTMKVGTLNIFLVGFGLLLTLLGTGE